MDQKHIVIYDLGHRTTVVSTIYKYIYIYIYVYIFLIYTHDRSEL